MKIRFLLSLSLLVTVFQADMDFEGPFAGTKSAVKIIFAEPGKNLVGRTFDGLVMRTGKALFVRFYAPWGGHCKHMAPAWNELAEMYADSDKIVIADVDATKYEDNTVAGHHIVNFPTLKFFPEEGEEFEYNGGRTVAELAAFVESQIGEK